MKYGSYIITTDGRVFNRFGKELSGHDNGKGYLIVSLTINGTRLTKAVHRLVAEVRLPNPENLPEVDHINNIRDDNRLENLMWVTKEQNVQKSYDTGGKSSVGIKNGRCKTDLSTVHEICKHIKEGLSSAEIRDIGFDYEVVRAIKSKRNWEHISNLYF